jgi:NADP-dependent 3-hydroxy acid dehydrogenase YdfG
VNDLLERGNEKPLPMSKKLENKVAVITGATSGMALATAKLFIEEGSYVFITGRSQERLDKAIKEIGKNVTGVKGDSGNLADLDRLFETVKKEKGHIDVLFASAPVMARSITHSAPLLRMASTIRSMSTFAGPCLPCKRLCRS